MSNHNREIEVSSREFQRKLFDWFEKRGLLSELRAFMRHRMISALYSSESPCPAPPFSTENAASPTLQAMLLLVAEFLVQQEYHYTMSVMVAEAPLLASFPKFSGYVSYMSQTDNMQVGTDFPRYSEKDVQEILEVFGMTPHSESMQHVLRLYSNNKARESLLACVLTALSVIVQSCASETSKKSTSKNSLNVNKDMGSSIQWIEEIRLVLLRAQLTSRQLLQVEELLRKLQSDTADKVRREEREKNKQLNHIREQELLAEALVREEKSRAQTQEADEDLRNKQKHLEQVTNQLRQQHDEVLHRLNRVQRHADEVRRQEDNVLEREKALEKKQALLEEEHRSLAGLRAELQDAAHSLRQEHSDTKTILELKQLQERCLHLESELKETKNAIFSTTVSRADMGIQVTGIFEPELSDPNKVIKQNHQQTQSSGSSYCSSTDKHSQAKEKKERNSQVTLLKRVLRRVQQENSELRAIAVQQRRRVDELTNRAAQLANELAEQSPVPPLSQIEPPAPVVQAPEPALKPPTLSQPHIPRDFHTGAGGDVNQAASRHSPLLFTRTLRAEGREWRRKPPKRLLQNISLTTSFSSDDSPTEEVLREARNRLKRLEEESEAVDRRYRDFRARQADCLTSTTSMLFAANDHPATSLPMGQPHLDTPSASTAHHLAPSLLRPTTIQSPPVSGPAASSATLQGRTSSLPAFPQTQLTFPERSAFSLPLANSSSLLQGTSPFASSFLRRPVDRLRNFLGSRPSFTRGFSEETTTSLHAASGINQNLSPLIQVEKSSSEVLKTVNEMQKLNVNPSPKKDIYSSNASVLVNQQDLEQSSIQNAALKDNTRNNSNILSTSGVVEEAVPAVSTLNTALSAQKSMSHQSVEKSSPMSSGKIPQRALPSLLNPGKPLPDGQQDSSMNIPDAEQSPASSKGSEQPPEVPLVQTPELVPSPNRQIVKPVDTTLNEVSTLSSSPGLSSAKVGSVKNKMISSPTFFHEEDGKENRKPVSSVSLAVEDQRRTSEHEGSIAKLATAQEQKNYGESSVPGRASQLLNTSLSSIENSEPRVSAGSGGKKSGEDDDDDFW